MSEVSEAQKGKYEVYFLPVNSARKPAISTLRWAESWRLGME